ncbi:MAG TPA: S41 family peptidase [Acidobacteriota bacterium]|nr:S41 family peptidase [Acidobacteriota bacterium]
MPRICKRLAALLLISFFAFSTMVPASENDPQAAHVERIEALGRLWGDVLLHHPWIPTRGIDWDAALEEALRTLEANDTHQGLVEAVDLMLAKLDDPMTERVGASEEPEDESAFPKADSEEFPSVTRHGDGTVVVAINDHGRFVSEFPASREALEKALLEARSAPRMVLDLRGNRSVSSLRDSWIFNLRFRDLFAHLSGRDLVMPTLRSRIHNGFRPQRPGGTSGNYYSGFVVPDHDVIASQASSQEVPGRLVLVVNSTNSQGYDAIIALRGAGSVRVVMDGQDDIDLSEATSREVAQSLSANIRTSQMLLADGRTTFQPDARVSSAGSDSDRTLEAALQMVRQDWQEGTASVARQTAAPAAPGWFEAYADEPFPSRERRLMGLFRLWCVFDAMHPYLDLLDYSWDKVLTDMIPVYEQSSDALAYHMAVLRTMALTQDTHSGARSDVLRDRLGRGTPPLRLSFVEDRPVVLHVEDPELPVDRGDELLAVNGEPVEAIIQRHQPYIAYSTPQSLQFRLAGMLIRGDPEGTAELKLGKADGSTTTVEVPLNSSASTVYEAHLEATRPDVVTTLEDGTAYVDLVRLNGSDVAQAEQAIRKAGRAVIDIRGYPRGTAFLLAPMLAGRTYDAAHFERPMRMSLTGRDGLFRFDQRFSQRPGFQPFQGKLVILINEFAISQSEHSCLLLDQAVEDVTFLGSPTQGANGDVTGFRMPGGIEVGFTGQAVSHMDGRQLQRVGIQPDIPVKPTIAGIRAGRDELLEAAVEFLNRR